MPTQRRRDAEKNQALDAMLKARVEETLSDPQPSIPQANVFADLRAYHEARIKT